MQLALLNSADVQLAALRPVARMQFCSIDATYRTSIRVVIPGNGGISSSEGTSQGDPLAMGMYMHWEL